jgi:hypothetical protein
VKIVGREEELARVCAFLDEPRDALAALLLAGEAGIGKSTIWLAGVEHAREHGARTLVSRPAEAERGLAHAGLADLFEGVLDDVLPELAAPRRRALEVALLLEEPDARVDPRALATATRSVLQLLAEQGPTVIAIDDVQWFDASSATALTFALRRLHDVPLALLLAQRSETTNSVALEEGSSSRSARSASARCTVCSRTGSAGPSLDRRSSASTNGREATRFSRSRSLAPPATGCRCQRRSKSSCARGSPACPPLPFTHWRSRPRSGRRRSCCSSAQGSRARC